MRVDCFILRINCAQPREYAIICIPILIYNLKPYLICVFVCFGCVLWAWEVQCSIWAQSREHTRLRLIISERVNWPLRSSVHNTVYTNIITHSLHADKAHIRFINNSWTKLSTQFRIIANSSLVCTMSASCDGGNSGKGGVCTKNGDDVEVAIDPGICQPRSQAFSEQVIEGRYCETRFSLHLEATGKLIESSWNVYM